MAVMFGQQQQGGLGGGGGGLPQMNFGGLFGPTSGQANAGTLGSAGSGAGAQSQSQSVSGGGSYFSDPNFINSLAGMLGGVAGQASQQYMPFIQNPTASPLFQNSLQGLLGALAPSEASARTNLLDQFRNAGMMGSGIFGNQAVNLERELERNRQELASKTLATMFPQVTQALGMPMQQIDPLIQALKLQQQQSQSQAVGANPMGGKPQENVIMPLSGGAGGVTI